jgi:hypothetical protein
LILAAWFSFWIVFAAKAVAEKAGDDRIALLGNLLPAFTVTTLLGVFALAQQPQSVISVVVLWWHHAAFLALFCFLLVGQFFQAEAWWNIRARRFGGAAASYRRLWLLTELVPASVALAILLTGLRLLWEAALAHPPAPGKSPAAFWLLAIIGGFGFFFWDGLLGYTPIVRKWKTRWNDLPLDNQRSNMGHGPRKLSDTLQLLIHFLSWPAVFLCGVYRWEFPNPATDFVNRVTYRLAFLPTGWPEVTVAVGIWLLAGGMVAALRLTPNINDKKPWR